MQPTEQVPPFLVFIFTLFVVGLKKKDHHQMYCMTRKSFIFQKQIKKLKF